MKKILFILFTLFTVNSYADCPGMTVFVNTSNVNCNGNCDGYGFPSIAGGSGNYNISYYNSSFGIVGTGPSVSNLCAGSYYIVVQDVTNACIDTSQFSILSPQPLSVAITSVINSSCFNSCDGSISAQANGGTTPYSYQWFDAATGQPFGQSGQTGFGLCNGTYYVIITDANGCMGQSNITTIGYTSPITVSLSPTNPT
jgi:hypothetical protein